MNGNDPGFAGAPAAGSRAALLTPAGRGAVAVVAASGPAAACVIDAHFRAANGRPFAAQQPGRIAFGVWRHAIPQSTGETATESSAAGAGEEVILSPCTDGVAEIHCHGGVAASGRILAALAAAGCEIVSWQKWLQQRSPCPLVAAADAALAAAATRRAAAILLDQRAGALRRAIESARGALAAADRASALQTLDRLLARAPLGIHLTRPWHVAVAGRPNVGKSSLVNALVGYQRAIVDHEPGTTRDVVAAETAVDGWPVRLTDSAGLRAAECDLEAQGVDRARAQLTAADLVLWVIDAAVLAAPSAAAAIRAADAEVAAEAGLPDLGGEKSFPRLVVVNKCDLLSPVHAAALADASARGDVVVTSATTSVGLDRLLAGMAQRLAPAPPRAGEAVPFTASQAAQLSAARELITRGDAVGAGAVLESLLRS